MNSNEKIHYSDLQNFIREIFLKNGFSNDAAGAAANVLVLADLRGIDSHGCARLEGYIRQVKEGRIDPVARFNVEHETPSTALLNANGGLGLISASHGMEIAIGKAKVAGSGWVAIKNSSHFGIAYAHAKMALEEDMIGFALTNASPLVAPAGSVEPMLGTNPICYAIPAGEEPPFVLDMATTVAANGKLEIASREGREIPEGWVQTVDGKPSTSPGELKNKGTLLPLGSDKLHGDHKGYGLGAVVDIFSGVLSGANYGPWVPPFVSFLNPLDKKDQVGEGIGHFVGAWRVDAFRPAGEFKDHMDNWIRRFRSSRIPSGNNPVMVAGDPERKIEAERKVNGIPLNQNVSKRLRELGEEFSVPVKFL